MAIYDSPQQFPDAAPAPAPVPTTLNPAFANEFARIKAAGDPRDEKTWLRDHFAAKPEDAAAYPDVVAYMNGTPYAATPDNGNTPVTLPPFDPADVTEKATAAGVTPEQSEALMAFINGSPEQAEIFASMGNDLKAYGDFVINWWKEGKNADGSTPSDWELKIFDTFGEEWDDGGSVTDDNTDAVIGTTLINDVVMPGIASDVQNKKIADEMMANYKPALDATNKLVGDITVQRIDANGYLAANPDLTEYYNANKLPDGSVPGFPGAKDLASFAQSHWDTYGKNEGRQGAGTPMTDLLRQEYDNNWRLRNARTGLLNDYSGTIQKDITDTESAYYNNLMQERGGQRNVLNTQLTSLTNNADVLAGSRNVNLGNQITAMQGNLATEVGSLKANQAAEVLARKGNLQTELDTKGQGITDQTTALKASLQTELDSLKGNLSGELGARAAALQAQLDTLEKGIGTFTAAETAALTKQITDNFASLETEVGSRRSALERELATNKGALTEADVARRAALELELGKLTAAQQPLNNARTAGAEAQGAAVNLGVQSERDRIVAEMAQQGYIGGSTGTDQALLRASITGRQGAAQAATDAATANASDNLALTRYGAGAERGISEDTIRGNRDLTVYGAAQNRGIDDYASGSRKTIEDFAADNQRGISHIDAVNRLNLNKFGADENRAAADYASGQVRYLDDYGAVQTRQLTDAEAEARKNLTFYGAEQNRDLGDYDAAGILKIGNYDASQTRGIGDFNAAETRGIADEKGYNIKGISDYGSNALAKIDSDQVTGVKNIFDNSATARSNNTKYVAGETMNIGGAAADQEFDYFNKDTARRIGALALPAGAIMSEFGVRNAAGDFGQSGTNRVLPVLTSLYTNGGSPPSAVGTSFNTENAWASGLENVGAGLFGAAINIGNANKWKFGGDDKKTPTTTPPPANGGFVIRGDDGDGFGSIPD